MNGGVFDNGTTAATIGGTMLSILPVISEQDILKTVLLASVGAVVSYLVSFFMKRLFRKFKQ